MTTIWHDVECGAYEADLPLWGELADEGGGPVLDLGCGSGRVSLHLARRGHRVLGLDSDPDLVSVLAERASGLPVEAEVGDARDFDLGVEFGTVLVPMQLLQLFADTEERISCLRCVGAHLRPGARAAIAIVEDLPTTIPPSPSSRLVTVSETKRELGPPLPDAREVDGWVYSSLPLEIAVDDGTIVVRRLRQTVDPAGDLSEEVDEVRLQALDAATVENEAREAELRPVGCRAIDPTDAHVGSTVVLLERGA
ncbi:MAG TPA: class I SAM-dependent methyltransferase [Solirubrobacterales bacterium]|nr:class I SAM-dependent methyltransferase [Solirubrobacterales bacterium]